MIFRHTEKDDTDKLLELFHLCFGNESTRESWQWKYHKAPFGSASVVAEENGQIIAHYGGVIVHFQADGRKIKAFMGCDVMTHPAYRAKIFSRKGVLVRTAEFFFKSHPDIAFTFGFPPVRHALLGKKTLRYTDHRIITRLTRKSEIDAEKKIKLPRISIGWDSLSADSIDRLWQQNKNTFPLALEKTCPYIFWRYRDCPDKKFIPVVLKNIFGKVKGYAITSLVGNECRIYDFFIEKDFGYDKLVLALQSYAVNAGAETILLWASSKEPLYKDIENRGYQPADDVPYVFIWIQDNALTPEFLLENYCYRLGDYDAS